MDSLSLLDSNKKYEGNITMQWFVVHTLTGHEQKVKKILQKLIKERQLENSFGRIIIPVENLVRIRKGKRVVEERRLYPGYLVIEMDGNDETLRLVNSISGVTHFLGSRRKPTPLSQEEIEALLVQVKESKDKVVTKIPFTKGERVTVIDGPFSDFIGTVEEVYPEREKVKVLVVIFGRTTPIELGFHQLKAL
ncbi:MAG: transcription termination/antitermination factor NusG [candidate division WOR-3 bacterium]|nr:MAG: transcription termination/antitermination factor NusG [candidate division WOR-3 bacterium]